MYHLMQTVRGKQPRKIRTYKTIEGARKALESVDCRHFIQYTPEAIEKARMIGRHYQAYAQIFSKTTRTLTHSQLPSRVALRGGVIYHGPRDAYHDVPLALARGYLPKSTRGGARHA